jgi:HAD superfamily phosphatase (TIGR01668 family)
MFEKLKPDLYYQNIFAIDFGELARKGVRGLICDIDNTIIPWSEDKILKEVTDWFAEIKKKGFSICLVSNGKDKRVKKISRELAIPALGLALKPSRKAFKKAQEILKLKKEEIAVIGDQLFTDILGGNRMGFKTILVDPMSSKEFFTTMLVRRIEGFIYKRRGNSE